MEGIDAIFRREILHKLLLNLLLSFLKIEHQDIL